MRVIGMAHKEVIWIEVVGMRVGDEKIFDFIPLDSVIQKMHIAVRRKIYKQILVYKRL
jgi:hypothetical protein